MITLTTPKAINNVLGGTTTVAYDKLVVTNVNYDTINKRINGSLRLTCTADSAQTPMTGVFQVLPNGSPATVQVDLPDLPFHRIINLTAPQQTVVLGWFDTIQSQIENGFISLAAVAGTQSAGT